MEDVDTLRTPKAFEPRCFDGSDWLLWVVGVLEGSRGSRGSGLEDDWWQQQELLKHLFLYYDCIMYVCVFHHFSFITCYIAHFSSLVIIHHHFISRYLWLTVRCLNNSPDLFLVPSLWDVQMYTRFSGYWNSSRTWNFSPPWIPSLISNHLFP